MPPRQARVPGAWYKGDPYQSGPVNERIELERDPSLRGDSWTDRLYEAVIRPTSESRRTDTRRDAKYGEELHGSRREEVPPPKPRDPCDVCKEDRKKARDERDIDILALLERYWTPGGVSRATGIPYSTVRDLRDRQLLVRAGKIAAGVTAGVLGVFGLRRLLKSPPKEEA